MRLREEECFEHCSLNVRFCCFSSCFLRAALEIAVATLKFFKQINRFELSSERRIEGNSGLLLT